MDVYEFFLNEYKNGRFTINFETGEIYSPKYNRTLGCVHKRTGYVLITLRDENGVRYQLNAHRIIWYCYHNGVMDRSLQINHINGIKTDNSIKNLELVTVRENIQHAFRTGLMSGEKHSKILKEYYKTHPSPNRKFSIDVANEIRDKYATGLYSFRELGRMYKADKGTIKKIVENTHYKF